MSWRQSNALHNTKYSKSTLAPRVSRHKWQHTVHQLTLRVLFSTGADHLKTHVAKAAYSVISTDAALLAKMSESDILTHFEEPDKVQAKFAKDTHAKMMKARSLRTEKLQPQDRAKATDSRMGWKA